MKSVLAALSVALLGACMVGEDLEVGQDVAHEDDPEYDDGPADPLAYNARGWVIPAEVRAIADQQSVAYTGAGAWSGGAKCGGTLLAGTRAIGDYVDATFAGTTGYGGYVCRPNTANRSQLSVHGTGRAIDIMIPLAAGSANNAAGDPIANFLVENAEKIGVQFVIWDRNSWGASRSLPKLRAYGGPNPHTDHIHVELSPEGARRMTEWFRTN